MTLLLDLFAAIALSAAIAGIYAVVSRSVAKRKMEMGIRMALAGCGKSPDRLNACPT